MIFLVTLLPNLEPIRTDSNEFALSNLECERNYAVNVTVVYRLGEEITFGIEFTTSKLFML